MTHPNKGNYKAVLFFIVLLFLCLNIIAQDNANYTSTEIIYGRKDGMALTMFKITPKQNAKGKAIVSVISGNWNSNFSMSSRYMMRSMYLVNNGFTVFFVMHGSQPRYAINDEVADVKRAVRFIRYNAKEYGIDGEHIGISGSSSGGHLSLMVSLSDDKSKFSADPVDKVSSRVQAAAVFSNPALYGALTATTVRGIVVYHIFSNTAFTANFPTTPTKYPTLLNTALPTHPGVELAATFTGAFATTATVKGLGNATAANITINGTPAPNGSSDQFYINGVLHKINQVLIPQ